MVWKQLQQSPPNYSSSKPQRKVLGLFVQFQDKIASSVSTAWCLKLRWSSSPSRNQPGRNAIQDAIIVFPLSVQMENSFCRSATMASHNTQSHFAGCIHPSCLRGTSLVCVFQTECVCCHFGNFSCRTLHGKQFSVCRYRVLSQALLVLHASANALLNY